MKINTRTLHVAVLVDKDLPTDHSFIQGTLEKGLLENNCKVSFVGFNNKSWSLPINPQVQYLLVPAKNKYFLLRKIEKLIRFGKLLSGLDQIDVLFTRNDPAYLIIGWWLKRKQKSLVHFHQISHLHAFSETEKSSFSFHVKAWGDKILRKLFLGYADRILLISASMQNFLIDQWPRFSKKYTVFPLGVAESDFNHPIPFSERQYEVTYIGTTASSRKLGIVIQAIQYYHEHYGPIKLHIWGQSHRKIDDEELMQVVEDLRLSQSIIFHGRISRNEVLKKIMSSKIGLSTIPAYGLFKQLSPTKLMEYLAAGCCVIGTRGIPEQETIIAQSGAGILVDFEAKAIANAIHLILSDSKRAAQMANAGRAYIFRYRSYTKMSKQLYKEMISHLEGNEK